MLHYLSRYKDVGTLEDTITKGKSSILDAKNVLASGVKCPAMTQTVEVSNVSVVSYI